MAATPPRRDPPMTLSHVPRGGSSAAASSSDDHDDAGAAKFGANLTDGDYAERGAGPGGHKECDPSRSGPVP